MLESALEIQIYLLRSEKNKVDNFVDHSLNLDEIKTRVKSSKAINLKIVNIVVIESVKKLEG